MKRQHMLETMQQFRQWDESAIVVLVEPKSFTKVFEAANRVCDRYLPLEAEKVKAA